MSIRASIFSKHSSIQRTFNTMGFHLYHRSLTNSDSIELDYLKPIRLSGENGLIANFIHAHSDEDLETWELSLSEIAELTQTDAADLCLIWYAQMEDSGPIRVSVVTSLSGKSNIMDTEVLIMQKPIRHAEWNETYGERTPVKIRYPEQQKAGQTFESVLVKGGISNLQHSWKLAPPKMQIGGVIR